MSTETAINAASQVEAPLEMDFGFLEQVERESGVKVSRCFQCAKCSNGCPLAFAMDYPPYQVVRLVQLGAREQLMNARTIWVCASCQTCVTRCPNEIDIPRLMDYLKETVCKEDSGGAGHRTAIFHEQFLKSVERYGRVFEGGLMQSYMLRSGAYREMPVLVENAKLGLKMARKNRMRLFPKPIKGRKDVKTLFENSQ